MRNFGLFILVLLLTPIFSIAQITERNFVKQQNITRSDDSELRYTLDFENAYSELRDATQTISLPNLDGQFEEFVIEPSNVIAPEVKHYYTIKTFRGYKKGDKKVSIALDATRGSFQAAIKSDKKYFIEKELDSNSRNTIVVKTADKAANAIDCDVEHLPLPITRETNVSRNSDVKKKYKIAIASAGEYSTKFGGSTYDVTNVLNSLASGVNMANVILNKDLGIELQLVSTPEIIFSDANTDPYDPTSRTTVLSGNDTVLDEKIGEANYDIGHVVMWANYGGVAYVGSMCTPLKGAGFSSTNSTFEKLWNYYFVHELGHQFGANHTFSATTCRNSRSGKRFEPGAGGSIMGYVNLCGGTLQPSGNVPYYHPGSLQEINTMISTRSCGEDIYVDNEAPVADAGSTFVIPKSTPFILVGDAADEDDATLTYQWEQIDGDGDATGTVVDCSNPKTALFKFKYPQAEKYREFPRHKLQLKRPQNPWGLKWEVLPCTPRDMHFAFVSRDNDPKQARIGQDSMTVRVADTGPFELVPIQEGLELTTGMPYEVQWTVNGTDSHTPSVDILFSADDGLTYSVLASKVANNGRYYIGLPNIVTTTGRLVVRSHVENVVRNDGDQLRTANSFYAVSLQPLTIVRGASAGALPVELADFSGMNTDFGNELRWTTTSETNNKGFNVQKLEYQDWVTIGYVDGNGTTTDENTYRFVDQKVEATNAYRLEQEDFDGAKTYSDVVIVNGENQSSEVAIFKNTNANRLELQNITNPTDFKIYNMQGKVVDSVSLESDSSIDISKYSHGVYVVNYEMNSMRYSVKVVL